MKRMAIVINCFICFSLLISGIAWGGNKSSVHVYVKNNHNRSINPDRAKAGNKSMPRYGTGYYRYRAEGGYHTFSVKKGSETKSKQSKVRPPSTKKVTIRFSRH